MLNCLTGQTGADYLRYIWSWLCCALDMTLFSFYWYFGGPWRYWELCWNNLIWRFQSNRFATYYNPPLNKGFTHTLPCIEDGFSPCKVQTPYHDNDLIFPLTLPNPILLNAARSSMRLRCGSGEVRMLAPVGPFFWPLPILAPWWLFLVFFC